MSTQSITEINISKVSNELDDYLVCEGNSFRNIVNYDLDLKVDYDKIKILLYMEELLCRTKDCEKVILIMDKILK
jgi:hypothetical protein